MRCPDCNKFVSFDTDLDPEEDGSPEVEGTSFAVSYRRVLACGDCGTELKEATIELEHDFEAEIEDSKEKKDSESKDKHEHTFEVENCDASATSRLEDKDRNGKQIKNSRYMRMYYGVQCTVEVKCECGASATFEIEGDEQASSFEELT